MTNQLSPQLPDFPFHPDPVGTGSIVKSSEVCACCGLVRGYSYAGPVYAKVSVAALCPWCIADGSASRRFDADFVDGHFNDGSRYVELPREWYFRVFARTPGFASFNAIAWRVHCGEPAAFIRRKEPYELVFRCRLCAAESVVMDLD